MAISMVQVRGHYEDAHRTLRTGSVTLTPSFPISNGTTTITGIPVTTDLVNGNISVTVAAGNDPGTTPTGMVYQVAEILDVPNKPPLVTTYNITVSAADAAAGIDLATAPRAVVSQPTYAAYLTQITGDARYLQLAGGTLTGALTLPALRMTTGPANGAIFTSDGSGNGSWQVPGAASGTDWLNVKTYLAKGDGTTDDTTAIQSALTAAYADSATAPMGKTVYLPAGTYRTSAPLIVPPYVTLRGTYAMRGTNIQKSIIKPLGSFAGTAILSMVDATTGGYATPSEGQRFVDITLDGSALGATTASGIIATGMVHGVGMRNVSIDKVTDRGVQTVASGANHPYSWNLENVQVSTATLDGFRLSSTTDTTMIGCRAIGCGRRGFYLDGMANSTFTACRSEFSGENGWYITAAWSTGNGSGGALWQGCSTDRSVQNGFLIDATGNSPLIFTSTMARRDGSGSTSAGYAGFKVNASTAPVIINGISTYPGVGDDGTGLATPQYGLSITGSTFVSYADATLHAITAGFINGGTNTTVQRGIGVLERTGTTAAPTDVLRGLQVYGSLGDSIDVPGNLSGIPQPRAHGALAWTFEPGIIGAGKAPQASGTLYLAAVYVPRPLTVTKLWWGISSSIPGSGATAGQNFVGLYDSTGARLASVGVDARIGTSGPFTETISAAVTPGLYWVAFLINATTLPAIYRGGDQNATLINFNQGASALRYATNGAGLTALPTTIAPSSNAAAQYAYWAAIG